MDFQKHEELIRNQFNQDNGIFHYDGIIDETVFKKEKIRLLFICKEPNESNHVYEGDLRKWFADDKFILFKRNVALWSYGILNGFRDYGEVNSDRELITVLQRIAFINLKKTGGTGLINKTFKSHIEHPEIITSLRNQIMAINPTHIILCLGEHDKLSAKIFSDVKPILSDKKLGMAIDDWNGIKLIHFAHPSGRTPSAVLYYYMKVMWQAVV